MGKKVKALVELTIDDDVASVHSGNIADDVKGYLDGLLEDTEVEVIEVKQVWEASPEWIELHRAGVTTKALVAPAEEDEGDD